MPINIKNSKLALIGLIILFAVSSLMAGGGKPKIVTASANLQPLSSNEVMEILLKFPEMVPEVIKDDIFNKKDQSLLESWPITKLEGIHLLNSFFSTTNFYKTLGGGLPPYPYLMAVKNSKRYNMPSDFNRLLLDNGLEVTDKNIIELAKTFIIVALGSEPVFHPRMTKGNEELFSFPQITFLEGKRSVDKKQKPPIYWVHIEAEVNKQKQEWNFRIRDGLFQWATRRNEGETSIKYYDFVIPEKEGKRGEIDLDKQIDISTDTSESKATVEFDINNNPHYYLIVKNNEVATGYKVKFELSGFQSYQPDVYILVRCINAAYADTLLRQVVEIDPNGNGSFVWYPTSETTCITRVWALWAIDTIDFDTTSSKELTLEKVITGNFTNDTTYKIYFCHQFFVFTNHQIFSHIA